MKVCCTVILIPNKLYMGFSQKLIGSEGITYPASSPTYPPPTNPNTKYGFFDNPYAYPPSATGMPLAWTGTASMSIDGYNTPDYGSYCYVGWEAISPFMVNPKGYNGMQYK